jgi:hypothetical protein
MFWIGTTAPHIGDALILEAVDWDVHLGSRNIKLLPGHVVDPCPNLAVVTDLPSIWW